MKSYEYLKKLADEFSKEGRHTDYDILIQIAYELESSMNTLKDLNEQLDWNVEEFYL